MSENKHCCDHMDKYSKDDCEIFYSASNRSYSLKLNNELYVGDLQTLWYCPWCGSKLPKELDEKMEEVLKEEFGLEDPFGKDRERIPPEFHTDEWWKKRGL